MCEGSDIEARAFDTARLEQHAIAMGMRMCPLSMTPVPQLFFPNYTLRQTIATYNRTEDWDEIAMFALHAPNQSPGAL